MCAAFLEKSGWHIVVKPQEQELIHVYFKVFQVRTQLWLTEDLAE